jgi:site-specific DNA-methyltransferase (adenine-specific)
LLKNGRDSYVNADKEALSLLSGIPFNPVQRNKGIDAILVEQYENTPVLVRIQRGNETLSEAASYLLKAKETKQSKKVILIQTHENDLFSGITQAEGLVILQSPSLQINKELTKPSTRTTNHSASSATLQQYRV